MIRKGNGFYSKRKTILLKLSGAALKEEKQFNILNKEKLLEIAKQVIYLSKKYNVSIVIGGGNIWRGCSAEEIYKKENADYMGMLATIINSIALKESIIFLKGKAIVFSSIKMPDVLPSFSKKILAKKNKENCIYIFGGGTGKPFCTTDTAAAKKALEVKADIILIAKDGVDGVYDSDPKKNSNAIRYSNITYKEILKKNIMVMDKNAIEICKKNKIDLIIFNMMRKNAIIDVMNKKIPFTKVSN